MEHLLQNSKCSIFRNISKYIVFQRHQKVLLWSKGLNTADPDQTYSDQAFHCLLFWRAFFIDEHLINKFLVWDRKRPFIVPIMQFDLNL